MRYHGIQVSGRRHQGRWAQVIADQARLRQVSEIARGYLPLLLGWRLRYATLSRLSGLETAVTWSRQLTWHGGLASALETNGVPYVVSDCPRRIGLSAPSAGQVTVISARTSVGKSKLLQNVIHYNVATAGVPTHFYP